MPQARAYIATEESYNVQTSGRGIAADRTIVADTGRGVCKSVQASSAATSGVRTGMLNCVVPWLLLLLL